MANLIGTKPNQVPTNGSLGTMAFQDANNVSDVTFIDTVGAENLSLTAIAQTKSESAVDVFVYDTSKDSDGGAWRHRTQHTSWYNEPLNTSTRGSRKEFPAVAVIVAESNKVTIYDGDDPSLPMWMVFNVGGSAWASNNFLAQSGASATWSLSAINGTIIFAPNASYRMRVLNFISEYGYVTSDSGAKKYNGSISERNAGKGNSDITMNLPVSSIFYDVAMTVLPDAPIDQATGLPIPTIAVATDGGVSVIKDDGTVVDLTSGSGSTFAKCVSLGFTSDNKLIFNQDNTGRAIYIYGEIPDEDTVATLNNNIGTNGFKTISYKTVGYGNSQFLPHTLGFNSSITEATSKTIGTVSGISKLDIATDVSKSLASYITSDYNTGWMNGDIKLATLSDTDDTDLVGSELVTNGTFDTDLSGWTTSTGWSYSAGKAVCDGTTLTPLLEQNISIVAGKTYIVEVTVSNYSSGACYVVLGGVQPPNNNLTSNGSKVFTVTAGSNNLKLSFATPSGTYSATLDNISVRLAEPDRSVNNNGLQVFGTVQKNPVATGADLVAYSGFTYGSNYLVQPYNSDLDFGTGDFCVMGWVNSVYDSNKHFFGIVDGQGSGWGANGYIAIKYNSANSKLEFILKGGTIVTVTPPNNVWQHICLVRKNGVVYCYLDSVLIASASNTEELGATTPESKTYIGTAVYGGNTVVNPSTKQALWRISGTAPTAEQIERIYQDEKVLFQENAKATLHGTSDAVTALAYDSDFDLLHVGTSAGRSVFQGLRRVDNTTDAVGVAISASNGLVAEE